jgi:hypothetical protein
MSTAQNERQLATAMSTAQNERQLYLNLYKLSKLL